MLVDEVRKCAAELDAMARLLSLEREFGAEAVDRAIEMWRRARETNVWRWQERARERIRAMAEVRPSD